MKDHGLVSGQPQQEQAPTHGSEQQGNRKKNKKNTRRSADMLERIFAVALDLCVCGSVKMMTRKNGRIVGRPFIPILAL